MRRWIRRPPGLGDALDRALDERLGWTAERAREWSLGRLERRLGSMRRAGIVGARGDADVERWLASAPVTGRADLAGRLDRYVDARWPRVLLRSARTSGTSGEPLTVLRDPTSMWMEEAFLRRQLRAFGLPERARSLAVRADGPREGPPVGRIASRDEWQVAASRLDDATAAAVVGFGEDAGVALLRGYPSALLELARRVDALGLRARLRRWPLRLLHVSSETLSEGDQARLEEAFGVPVAEQYGQGERALLIQSCPAGARHLMTDYGWGEVDGGIWLGTPLFGALLLPRYRTGDEAGELAPGVYLREEACGCGWPFPVVGRVLGREDAVITLPDGRRVGRLGPALRAAPGVAWAQVEQREVGDLLVRFGARAGADEARVATALEREIADLLRSPETRIELVAAPALREPSGKVRAVILRRR